MPKHHTVTDHLGNEYPSLSAMAKAWGISDSTLWHRTHNMHLSIEQALTLNHDGALAKTRQCTDHLGNAYPSKKAMCRHYGIDSGVYFSRIGIGWSQEKALTTPLQEEIPNAKAIKDHLGQAFPSVSAMCSHWSMTRSTYNARIKNGWTTEQALTMPKKHGPIQAKAVTDHLGNHFPTVNAMCRHYGITKDTYHTRLRKLGWTKERALTEPTYLPAGKEIEDYLGRKFPAITDLCHFYGLQPQDLQGKEPTDETFQKAIKRRYRKGQKFGSYSIKRTLDFPWFLMAGPDGEYAMSLEQLLDLQHGMDFLPFPKGKMTDRSVRILEPLGFPLYRIEHGGKEQVWDYWKIIWNRKQKG